MQSYCVDSFVSGFFHVALFLHWARWMWYNEAELIKAASLRRKARSQGSTMKSDLLWGSQEVVEDQHHQWPETLGKTIWTGGLTRGCSTLGIELLPVKGGTGALSLGGIWLWTQGWLRPGNSGRCSHVWPWRTDFGDGAPQHWGRRALLWARTSRLRDFPPAESGHWNPGDRRSQVCGSFLIIAVTNDYECSGWNQHEFIIL